MELRQPVRILLMAVVALSLVLSACQPAAPAVNPPAAETEPAAPAGSDTEDPAPEGEPVDERLTTLVVAVDADPANLEPATNRAFPIGSEIIINVFDTLVAWKAPDFTTLEGRLAETWEVSEDGLTYTFHLRDGLKWSDGSDLTAEDYVYTIQRVLTPATAAQYVSMATDYIKNAQEYYDGTATADDLGVKALDDKTLEITLAYPMASFLEMCSGTIYYPQRQDIMEKYGEKYGTEAEYTMGNGPYMM